jgi:hypothetical protein
VAKLTGPKCYMSVGYNNGDVDDDDDDDVIAWHD